MNLLSTNQSQAHAHRTVLVVEDESLIRAMVNEELSEVGYSLIESATGEEALAVLRSDTAVDCVITDMNMPGALDGGELVRVLRTEFPTVKVIMISGRSVPTDIRSLLDEFIAKPFNGSTVVDVVERLCPLN